MKFDIRHDLIFAVILALMIPCAWASLPVQLLSERYRTEWNWVEYRISLRNTSDLPVLGPQIRYFAENPWIQYCEPSPHAVFFLIEDEYNAGPLSLTLAGSIALSSAVNKAPVQILYTKVDSTQYGGLRLLSIRLQQTIPLQ